ncbi:MAG: cell division protein ZapA [Bacteroides sp.]|nr:cell division protein ZapA [Bacteroides sp.]
MTEKILNISVRIADQPRIALRIPASQEEIARRAEANINEMWRKWSAMDEFKDKSPSEILAMVTFRFAQLYFGAMETSDKVDRTLERLERSLDRMLFELTPAKPDPAREPYDADGV